MSDGTPSDVPAIPNLNLDFLSGPLGFLQDLPAVGGIFATLGDVFSDLNYMIWGVLVMVVVTWVVVFKTPIGLRLRAVGEHPRAADTVGISVYGVRYAAVIFSGMLAAAGGAYLTIGFVGSFNENITAGRGFIALAAVICGNWRPFQTAAICLLFGFSQALAQRLAGLLGVGRSPDRRALPGPPVRHHADRRRRRDRPLDATRRQWPSLQEVLRTGPRAMPVRAGPWSSACSRCCVMPVAIAATRWSDDYDLLHAGLAIPIGLLVGAAAISLSRSARQRNERSLGRAGGERAARIGRVLGVIAICIALTGVISLGRLRAARVSRFARIGPVGAC